MTIEEKQARLRPFVRTLTLFSLMWWGYCEVMDPPLPFFRVICLLLMAGYILLTGHLSWLLIQMIRIYRKR